MAPSNRDSTIYVALLRGINVGGNGIVSMRALKEDFERLGLDDVQTYINSGNVLFRSNEVDPRKLEDRIDQLLINKHRLKGKTVVRTDAEMARLVKTIEKEWKPDPEWRYNVIFLRHTLDPKTVAAGVELKPDIERLVCCPGTLLWSARTSSLTRTTMVKLSSRAMYQEMTVRSINTTRKILELMERMKSAPGAPRENDRSPLPRLAPARGGRSPRKARLQ